MRTEGFLTHITEACFLQGYMAGCAAIDHALLGNPYLVNAAFKSPLQTPRIRPGADEMRVLFLVMAPLAEEIFGGSNC
jgi:hypothetical protein